MTRRGLFDSNRRIEKLMETKAGWGLECLSSITHEHSLLQIAKLHDRAVINNNITLGLEYVIAYGGWSKAVRKRLEKMQKKLDGLAASLRLARNKALGHNDLAAVIANEPLGAFRRKADLAYFRTLQAFANLVHVEVTGRKFEFRTSTRKETADLVACIRP